MSTFFSEPVCFTNPFTGVNIESAKTNNIDSSEYPEMPTSTSLKSREKLVPKRELTLKGLGARQMSIDKLVRSTILSPIAPSPLSPTDSSERKFVVPPRTPRTPSTANNPEVPNIPHYDDVTPRCIGAFDKGPGTQPTSRAPRVPQTATGYPPRTPRTASAAIWEREHGFLPSLPERCQSVPLAEDWMPESNPWEAEADSGLESGEDCGFVDEDEDPVEAYNDDYEYDSIDEWGEDQPELTREEYVLMLEKMREEAEVSVCDGMMEQLELRDAFERAVEEMVRVKPEPERIRGLRRRRTIG